MYLATVIGSMWATQKHQSVEGMKLCWIQPIDEFRQPIGKPILALDPESQVGYGETVFYVDGGDAGSIRAKMSMPSDATIVAIVDSLSTDGASPPAGESS